MIALGAVHVPLAGAVAGIGFAPPRLYAFVTGCTAVGKGAEKAIGTVPVFPALVARRVRDFAITLEETDTRGALPLPLAEDVGQALTVHGDLAGYLARRRHDGLALGGFLARQDGSDEQQAHGEPDRSHKFFIHDGHPTIGSYYIFSPTPRKIKETAESGVGRYIGRLSGQQDFYRSFVNFAPEIN